MDKVAQWARAEARKTYAGTAKTAFINTVVNPVIRGIDAPEGSTGDAMLYGLAQGAMADIVGAGGLAMAGPLGYVGGLVGGHMGGGKLLDDTELGRRYRNALDQRYRDELAARR